MARLRPAAVLLLLCLAAAGQRGSEPSARFTARVQREVAHQILMLPYYGVFDVIGFKVQGYDVVLSGSVVNASLKSDAEHAVKEIEGVEKVINHIEILPLSPMDDRLRRSLYGSIYGYPSLERYGLAPSKPIRIIVKNGHVTLEGVVDSKADRDVANIRAGAVPGVFSVTNHLAIQNSSPGKK